MKLKFVCLYLCAITVGLDNALAATASASSSQQEALNADQQRRESIANKLATQSSDAEKISLRANLVEVDEKIIEDLDNLRVAFQDKENILGELSILGEIVAFYTNFISDLRNTQPNDDLDLHIQDKILMAEGKKKDAIIAALALSDKSSAAESIQNNQKKYFQQELVSVAQQVRGDIVQKQKILMKENDQASIQAARDLQGDVVSADMEIVQNLLALYETLRENEEPTENIKQQITSIDQELQLDASKQQNILTDQKKNTQLDKLNQQLNNINQQMQEVQVVVQYSTANLQIDPVTYTAASAPPLPQIEPIVADSVAPLPLNVPNPPTNQLQPKKSEDITPKKEPKRTDDIPPLPPKTKKDSPAVPSASRWVSSDSDQEDGGSNFTAQ